MSVRNFIRQHGLSDAFFLLLAAYMIALTITGCWIAADEDAANFAQHAIERAIS